MTGITTEEARLLYALKLGWEDKYHVSLTDGVWRAIRNTDALALFTADSGEELSRLINADYTTWVETRR